MCFFRGPTTSPEGEEEATFRSKAWEVRVGNPTTEALPPPPKGPRWSWETLMLCLAPAPPQAVPAQVDKPSPQTRLFDSFLQMAVLHQVLPGTETPLFVKLRSCGLAKANISNAGFALHSYTNAGLASNMLPVLSLSLKAAEFTQRRQAATCTRGVKPHYACQSFTVQIFASLHLQSFLRWQGRR